MGRVLAPGGRIIVPTFCHGEDIRTHFLSRLMGLAGFKARHRWSYGQFCQWVESCGYRITFAEKVQGSIPLAFVVAEKRKGIRLSDQANTSFKSMTRSGNRAGCNSGILRHGCRPINRPFR
ncbi:MAG: hypothetical protein IPK21_21900 [Haliscomenobacter sp.]|nr:hypothetical protein [Haliscomenobacter sp.]